MPLVPRHWQQVARVAALMHLLGKPDKGALIVAATGSGKTLAALHILDHWMSHRHRILWIAPQEELVFQPQRALQEHWPYESGIIKAERDECHLQVTFASIHTLARPGRLDKYLKHGVPTVVVCDEAHVSMTQLWRSVLDPLRQAGALLLGLTATPERSDGRNLSELWDLVYTYGLLDAIEDGAVVRPYVSECKLKDLDLARVAVARGDYLTDDLEKELMRAHVIEHTVEVLSRSHTATALPFRDSTMELNPKDGGVLVHCVSIDHAEATSEALREAGWASAVVHSKVKKADREQAIADFGSKLQVLCSPAALTQGVDLPYAMTNVIARPTQSHVLFTQQTGRVLRPHDGKPAGLLIDLVGATRRHSIVSAPVLVDQMGCSIYEDGKHRHQALSDGGGICECGHRVRCWRAKGSHKFKQGRCTLCDAPMCKKSADLHHQWIPWGDGLRRCAHDCGAETRDRLFTLASRRQAPEQVAWIHLAELGSVWTVDLGKAGRLYKVQKGEEWRPFWATAKGLKPLSSSSVTEGYCRLVTDDVARQATPVHGVLGVHPDRASAMHSRILALDLAKRLKLLEGAWRT